VTQIQEDKMIQPIVLYSSNHNILKTKTKLSDIQNDRSELEKLILDMKDTLESVGGLGLAANQIGRNESVCIVNLDGNIVTLVNPIITKRDGDKKISVEGCLSLPDISAKVERDEKISVTFINPDNDWSQEEIQVEFPNSVIIQHEVDHLNGKLMIDNLSPMQRELISTKLKKIARGNANINYVGMVWRPSQRSWSLVGPFHKLYEFYNYHSNANSFSTNGEVDGSITEGEIIINEEEGTQTQEDTSGEITEHEISQNA
jgi:peptide deformylase